MPKRYQYDDGRYMVGADTLKELRHYFYHDTDVKSAEALWYSAKWEWVYRIGTLRRYKGNYVTYKDDKKGTRHIVNPDGSLGKKID